MTTYSYRDFKLVATVKDSEGRTLDNTTSLDLRFTLSDPSMAILGNVAESLSPTLVPGVSVPGKPSQLIHPNGKVGDLNIQVAVAGYRCSKNKFGTKTDPTHLQRECVDICRSSISTFPAQPTCSFRGGGGGTS